jgi:hypothetical protein
MNQMQVDVQKIWRASFTLDHKMVIPNLFG